MDEPFAFQARQMRVKQRRLALSNSWIAIITTSRACMPAHQCRWKLVWLILMFLFFAHLLKNGEAQLNKIDEYLLI